MDTSNSVNNSHVTNNIMIVCDSWMFYKDLCNFNNFSNNYSSLKNSASLNHFKTIWIWISIANIMQIYKVFIFFLSICLLFPNKRTVLIQRQTLSGHLTDTQRTVFCCFSVFFLFFFCFFFFCFYCCLPQHLRSNS